MDNRPRGIKHLNLAPLEPRNYERYLPTAFDDSLTLIQKVNKVILYLHEYSKLTEDMLLKWNEVYGWIMNEGLDEAIYERLNEWYRDGRFEEILERLLLNEYARKDWVEEKISVIEGNVEEKLKEFEVLITKKISEFEKVIDELLKKTLNNDEITLTVGSGGDFTELHYALKHLNDLPIKPKKATVTILSGYTLNKQVLIHDVDMRYVTIEGSQTVNTKNDGSSFMMVGTTIPFIHIKNSVAPKIDVKFNFNGVRNYSKLLVGLYVDNSDVEILDGNGFTGFTHDGLYARNSHVVARNCDFSNNGNRELLHTPQDGNDNSSGSGLKVRNTTLIADGSIANNCGEAGFWVQKTSRAEINNVQGMNCGHHGLVVSQSSIVTARYSNFSNTLDNGAVATSSATLDLREGIVNNCGNSNVVAQQNSKIYFEGGHSSGSGGSGLNVTQFSEVHADRCTLNNNRGIGLECKFGSIANFRYGRANNNGDSGIYVKEGGKVLVDHAQANNNQIDGLNTKQGEINGLSVSAIGNRRTGVYAQRGGKITLDNATVTGNGEDGIRSRNGDILAYQCTIKNNGQYDVKASQVGRIAMERPSLSSSGETINIGSASLIQAYGVSGSGKANIPRNEVRVQGLIISDTSVT